MQSLVSIVVPAFNRDFIVGRALESLLAQTYSNWEALIVNDGSTDDTRDVVKEYQKRDARLILLEHERQSGAQAARNTGVRHARGEWIAFLDSDDQWLPDSLETRLSAAGKSPVVHSECYLLDDTGERRLFRVPPLRGQVYRSLLCRPGPVFPALLVSRAALGRLGPLDERLVAYQEWDTAIRLARYCPFEFVDKPTFIYDCRHANTISKNALSEARGYEQIVTKHRWAMLRYTGPKALAGHYRQAALFYHRANEDKRANRCALRAALCWPFEPGLMSASKRLLLRNLSKKVTHAHRNSP